MLVVCGGVYSKLNRSHDRRSKIEDSSGIEQVAEWVGKRTEEPLTTALAAALAREALPVE